MKADSISADAIKNYMANDKAECHPEPFDFAQDRLCEGSAFVWPMNKADSLSLRSSE